jgi:hypothetical protein
MFTRNKYILIADDFIDYLVLMTIVLIVHVVIYRGVFGVIKCYVKIILKCAFALQDLKEHNFPFGRTTDTGGSR